MNPWEIIGWMIAIPMMALTGLFVYAFVAVLVKKIAKDQSKTASKTRHLRAVD